MEPPTRRRDEKLHKLDGEVNRRLLLSAPTATRRTRAWFAPQKKKTERPHASATARPFAATLSPVFPLAADASFRTAEEQELGQSLRLITICCNTTI